MFHADRLAMGLALCVALLGGGLRLAQVGAERGKPLYQGDPMQYYRMGLAVRRTGALSDAGTPPRPTADRAISYPAFIAAATWPCPALGADNVRLAQALLAALCILLTYLLGARALSHACGLLAAGFLALNSQAIGGVSELYIECFFTFIVLLVALAWTRWARSPGWAQSVSVMSWVGISLACRSTLFALPPLFALGTLLRGSLGSWKKALLLCLCGYAALLPWVMRNARHFHAFIPFERHAATLNVYTASLGVIENAPNDRVARDLSRLNPQWSQMSGLERNGALLRMAAENVRRRPLDYLKACARRMLFLIGRFIQLLGAGGLALLAVGLWAAARNPALAALAELTAYWLAAHSLMSAGGRYLLPLLPVAGVLMGAGVCRVLGWCGAAGAFLTTPAPHSGKRTLALSEGLAFLIYAASLGVMAHEIWALPGGSGVEKGSSRTDFAAACRAFKQPEPGHERKTGGWRSAAAPAAAADAGLARETARLYLDMGEPGQALRILAGLGPARPGDAELALEYAQTLAACGQRKAALAYLKGARRPGLEAGLAGRMAVLYQQMKEYGGALSLLDQLILAQPAQARWRNDRGVVEMLLGRRDEAAEDFLAAIDLDPGFLPAYLSLGALYRSVGRFLEAGRLYEQALSQPAAREGAELRRLIENERKSLREDEAPTGRISSRSAPAEPPMPQARREGPHA